MTHAIPPDKIDIPMPIITPRLLIRPLMPEDGAEIHAAKMETWHDIHQWMPWANEIGTVQDTESYCRDSHEKFIQRQDFSMVAIDRTSGKIAVMTGLHRFDWDIRRMEIGFWARKDFQRRGLVSEITLALAHYAFCALNARTVAICHADGNDASRRVIERCLFTYEGRLRNALLLPSGDVRDQLWYSHTKRQDVPPLDITWGSS